MEIQQVRYFIEVCHTHNFTKAAARCGISQPSLTRAIKLLEAEFGGELFVRKPGKIDLTELGRIVRPYLENVWDQTTAVQTLTKKRKSRNPTQLRLAIMCTIAPKLFIETVSNFRLKHPDVQLEIIDGTAGALEDLLLDFQVDVAIYARPNREQNSRLNYLPLFREQMMIAIPGTHPLAQKAALRKIDLDGDSYINRALCEFVERAEVESEESRPVWTVACTSNRDDFVFAMVSRGFGFGFAPQHSIEGSGLTAVPLQPEIWREVHLVTVMHRPPTGAVGAFVHEAMQKSWPQ